MRLRKNLKLHPDLHLHDLRGSYLTWLAERGVHPKAAAQVAGHADTKVAMDLYPTVTRAMERQVAKAVEGLTNPQQEQ